VRSKGSNAGPIISENSSRGAPLAEGNQEFLAEIARLREDLRQLREVVNILVNVVMEEEWEEDETEFPSHPSSENRFQMYN
jgi:hypothetical protein